MQPIRILSPGLELLGEVDNYLSFVFSRNYHHPGEFQLVTSRKVKNLDRLEINNLIMVGADSFKTGIIRHIEITDEMLTAKGYALGIITHQRITIPPSEEAYDVWNGDGETVMKHYVQRNCLDIPGMDFPHLTIADNKHRGDGLKWQSRYKNLGDELGSISRFAGLGWRIFPDFNLGRWVFDNYNGRDLTAGQSGNPPVIFSPEFDNVKSQVLTDSLIGFGNYAIVAGQGEGAEREIALVGNNASGLDRHVIFVDARDLESAADLPGRGEAKLAECKRVLSFQTEVLTKGSFVYQRDFDVGDVVTVQNKDLDLTLDARITEVTEIYEAGGFRLTATFGHSMPTLAEKLKMRE